MNKYLAAIRLKKNMRMLNIDTMDLHEDFLVIKTFMYTAYTKSELKGNWACICEECFFVIWKFWNMPMGEQLGRSIGKLCSLLSKKFKVDEMSLILMAIDRYKYYDSVGSQHSINEFAYILTRGFNSNVIESYDKDKPRIIVDSQEQDRMYSYASEYVLRMAEELKRV
jgi:hypothetical protein